MTSEPHPDRRVTADAHYDAVMRQYTEMSKVRSSLVMPIAIVISLVFFGLLFLTNFTSLLDGFAFGGVTWAYLWAFATFFLVIILTTLYKKRMDAAEARLADLREEGVR